MDPDVYEELISAWLDGAHPTQPAWDNPYEPGSSPRCHCAAEAVPSVRPDNSPPRRNDHARTTALRDQLTAGADADPHLARLLAQWTRLDQLICQALPLPEIPWNDFRRRLSARLNDSDGGNHPAIEA